MSLLPQTILPFTASWGTVDKEGNVQINKNWWLFLWNLGNQTLGSGTSGLPASALEEMAGVDTDASNADAVSLRSPLEALAALMPSEGDPVPRPDVNYGQDLPDSAPLAQPVASITPTGSPFTYTAPFGGSVAVTGGTVSAISVSRQGTSVSTGVTVGLIPVARFDQVVVTYTGAPTMTFIPGSPQ